MRRIVGGEKEATKLIVHKKQVGLNVCLLLTRFQVTILFSDIEGFTSLSESIGLTTVMQLLGEYLAAMCDEVEKTNGTVGDFIGDGLMVFWNSPEEVPEHWYRAVECAMGMHCRLEELNESFANKVQRNRFSSCLQRVSRDGRESKLESEFTLVLCSLVILAAPTR